MRLRNFARCVGLVLLLSGAPSMAAPDLLWRGDMITARAFSADLAALYATMHKGKLTLRPQNTVNAIDAVADGSADIGGSARGPHLLRPEEQALEFHPIAYDALVLIVHPLNPVTTLSLHDLREIYLGRVLNWNLLGGKDLAINVYAVAGPLDGAEYSLRHLLFGNGDQRVAAPRLYLNTKQLEDAVAIDQASLGLTTWSNISASKMLKALPIEGRVASRASIVDGSYPLYLPLYLVVHPTGKSLMAAKDFLRFADSPEARRIMSKKQLVPVAEISDQPLREAQRAAYISARMDGLSAELPVLLVAATEPAVNSELPPLSAPNASVVSKTRLGPTAPSTTATKNRAAKAKALRRQKKSGKAARTEKVQVATQSEAVAPVAASTTAVAEPQAAPAAPLDAPAEIAPLPADDAPEAGDKSSEKR